MPALFVAVFIVMPRNGGSLLARIDIVFFTALLLGPFVGVIVLAWIDHWTNESAYPSLRRSGRVLEESRLRAWLVAFAWFGVRLFVLGFAAALVHSVVSRS